MLHCTISMLKAHGQNRNARQSGRFSRDILIGNAFSACRPGAPIGERIEVEQNQNVKLGVGAWSPPAAHLRSCRVPQSMLSKRLSPLSTNFATVLLPGCRTSIPFLPNLRQPVTVDRLPLRGVRTRTVRNHALGGQIKNKDRRQGQSSTASPLMSRKVPSLV